MGVPTEASSAPAARCAATGVLGGGPALRGHRPGQQAVVGADQDAVPGSDGDPAARGPDPRVYHRDVHAPRQVRDGLGQHRGATAHITGRHQVGNVDEPDPGGDAGGDPVAGRDEPVLQAVVGKERYAVE
jgi:hypothetical protein